MWWLLLFPLTLLLAVLAMAWILLPGISTYAARYYCGAVFISGRPLEEIKPDLFFKPISLAECEVDYKKMEVTASVWGLARRKARFVEGHGIKLLHGTPENLSNQPFITPSGEPTTPESWPVALNPDLNDWLQTVVQPRPGQTHAVVVLHRGVLLGEAYAPGIRPETPLHSWSLTKSLMNALTGILVERGQLSLDQIPDIPAWKRDGRSEITVKNLLQMTSGLKWKETENHFLKVSRMLFLEKDAVRHARTVPLAYPPGSHFAYASCNTNVLSGMIRDLFADDQAYYDFPQKALFEPLGMHHTHIGTDPSGNLVGSSFSMGTARDWARFGQLYLNQGRVGERQLLSPEWIAFTRESSAAAGGKYGAHFWLNAGGEHPDLPREMYYAAGFLGQRISIFPTQELVVVRLGLSFEGQFDHNAFLKTVLQYVS
ncbi:MAG: serine hydrolase [Bacteroidia bacterium]|nr:serine hydrolase [Bacteroidia bacterium]